MEKTLSFIRVKYPKEHVCCIKKTNKISLSHLMEQINLTNNRELRFLVVDDDKNDANLISQRLQNSRLRPRVDKFMTPAGLEDAIRENDYAAVFCDYYLSWPKFTTGLEVAQKVYQTNNKSTTFVMVSGGDLENIATTIGIKKREIITLANMAMNVNEIAQKEIFMAHSDFNVAFEKLALKGLFMRPLRVGFAGMGKAGYDILTQSLDLVSIKGSPLVSEAHVFTSIDGRDNLKYLIEEDGKDFSNTQSRGRIFVYDNLTDMFKNKLDLLIISRGSKNLDLTAYKSRDEAELMLTRSSSQKVDEVYQALMKSENDCLVMMISNRTSSHLLRGLQWNYEWKDRLIGVSRDSPRIRESALQILKEQIRKALGRNPEESEISKLAVWGDHGHEFTTMDDFEFMDLRSGKLYGIHDLNGSYSSSNSVDELAQKISMSSRKKGHEAQMASAKLGHPPRGLGRVIADFISSLATYQSNPIDRFGNPFSVQIHTPAEQIAYAIGKAGLTDDELQHISKNNGRYSSTELRDSFFNMPVSISYHPNLNFLPERNIHSLSPLWIKELYTQMIDQNNILFDAYGGLSKNIKLAA